MKQPLEFFRLQLNFQLSRLSPLNLYQVKYFQKF